jgi:hypothetical protein
LPKRRGFKGEKRRKELARLQKQQEKRSRRFGTQTDQEPGTPETETGIETETEAGTEVETGTETATVTEKREGEAAPTPNA